MTSMEAIKTYFSDGCRPVENKELMELRKSMSAEEWQKFGQDCAKACGQEWTQTK